MQKRCYSGTPFLIYGLVCPIKNEIVYEGATCDLDKRLAHHRSLQKTAVGKYFRQTLKNSGKSPKDIKAVVLQVKLARTERMKAEKVWIKTLESNHDLIN